MELEDQHEAIFPSHTRALPSHPPFTPQSRYMELEDQHEAIFPVIATFFGFTEPEVARLARAQAAHAQRNSVWGRTLSTGSFLLGVAQEAAQEVSNHNRAGGGGAGAGAS